jgi:hypothetical protein
MSAGRVVGIVIGALLGLLGLALLAGGAVLTIGYAIVTADDGYFDADLERLSTATVAITTEEADLQADPGPPDWVMDFLDVSVQIKAVGAADAADTFIGIGATSDVDAYLGDAARDEIRDVRPGGDVRYRTVPGSGSVAPPTDQTFWAVSASGPGTQELTWDVAEGTWTAVLMNSDGSPGVIADVTVGAKSPAVLPVGIGLLVVGLVFLITAVAVIVLFAVVGRPDEVPEPRDDTAALTPEPVTLEASLDEPLSQWLWLVKWFLAIPHFFLLIFLWFGFAVLTFIAFFAILFTGRYPKGMFDFNVGVMRWSWRVTYYAATGGLGTDRYPPFSLDDDPDYPAHLDVDYPASLSRGLVLVKWWLLAIPHYLILAVLVGAGWWGTRGWSYGGGLLSILVFIAAVALLFTRRYPRGLFDLVIGLNRWVMRVTAYAALMTDQYPPFRLDQGGTEPRTDDAAADRQ